MEFEIHEIPRTNQDIVMKMTRFKVVFADNTEFICRKLDIRPDHVYFSEKTQAEIDENTLDEIEAKIIKESGEEHTQEKNGIRWKVGVVNEV